MFVGLVWGLKWVSIWVVKWVRFGAEIRPFRKIRTFGSAAVFNNTGARICDGVLGLNHDCSFYTGSVKSIVIINKLIFVGISIIIFFVIASGTLAASKWLYRNSEPASV